MDDIKVTRPGSVRNRGPLKQLELNKYASNERLQYPLNLEHSQEYKHYIEFNINIPEKSQYKTNLIQTGGTSVADKNRLLGPQISGSQDPFSVSAAGAGVIVGLIQGFESLAGAAAGKGSLAGAIAGATLNAGIIGSTLAFVDMQRKTKRLAQSIYLYVPDTVQQTTTNKWSGVSLTEALGKAGIAAQGGQAVASELNRVLSGGTFDPKLGAGRTSAASASGGFTGELAGIAAASSGAYGSGIEKVMMASAGYAQNPQIEILFDSVDNRTFQFDFKFTPKSKSEAEMVLNIIKAFRYHAAPEIVEQGTGGGRFFIPPSEFDITYYFDGKENRALHKFSTCVLEAIDVNYSNGNFATYDDGIPVEIGMTLRFMEVEILHKKLIAEGY